MPEYLTPGVYLEETSFRSKSIEGVPTSTFGMAGVTLYGPVPYTGKFGGKNIAMVPRPMLVTSFTEFERAFGGLGADGTIGGEHLLYLAYAARAFFDNGGRRLYVARVFPRADNAIDFASFAQAQVGEVGTWWARWPGVAGSGINIAVRFKRSKNIVVKNSKGEFELKGVSPGAVVEEVDDAKSIPPDSGPDRKLPDAAKIKTVGRLPNGKLGLKAEGGALTPPTDPGNGAVCHITLDIDVLIGDRRDSYTNVEIGDDHPRSIKKVLDPEMPADELALVWFQRTENADAKLLAELVKPPVAGKPDEPRFLTGGNNGDPFDPDALQGEKSDPDDATKAATGLEALDEVEDIAIVAAPDIASLQTDVLRKTAVDALISHCQNNKYRIAIVDPPTKDTSISLIREFRSQFDTTYAALYYPWVDVVDPLAKNDPSAPTAMIALPPSGYTAGIYARSDIERGVHKAPANEVILGMAKFRQNVTEDRQAVLNPEGINALRYFRGRSNRVWGARTMSSDPEWKYVNVRRLFIYLERSIERSTQWAVFEPNNERLWANIVQTIEDFLIVTWKTGALMGTKPAEAFFVRCDRTTMTQNDLDNGRLICLIGVAPTYPAEFVIFRIGQWTADARQV